MDGLIPAPPKCPPHWPPAERVTWRSGWKAGYEQALKDLERDRYSAPGRIMWVTKPDNWVDES